MLPSDPEHQPSDLQRWFVGGSKRYFGHWFPMGGRFFLREPSGLSVNYSKTKGGENAHLQLIKVSVSGVMNGH